jgi:eukaryotic-like serine/threonine-protein kinase
MLIEITESPENEGWFMLAPGATSLTKIKELTRDRIRTPEKGYPSFLPDGEHFLFTESVNGVATLLVGSIDGEQPQPLVPSDSRGIYASGFLLYVREGTLLAQPFDAGTRTTTGDPVRLQDDIEAFSPFGRAAFSASQTGLLLTRPRDPHSRLRWFERDGRPSGTMLEPAPYYAASLAGSSRRLAVSIFDPRLGSEDVWIADLDRTVPVRLTSAPRS